MKPSSLCCTQTNLRGNIMKDSAQINIHKLQAMGGMKMAKGGRVGLPGKATMPMNPITEAKMNNGVPGLKKGGSVCKCKGAKCTCGKGKK